MVRPYSTTAARSRPSVLTLARISPVLASRTGTALAVEPAAGVHQASCTKLGTVSTVSTVASAVAVVVIVDGSFRNGGKQRRPGITDRPFGNMTTVHECTVLHTRSSAIPRPSLRRA